MSVGLEQIEEFARSFNGYEHWGEQAIPRLEECERRFYQSGELPEQMADLRAALFMSWRAYDHGGQAGELSGFFYAVFAEIGSG
ncbi:hypothetical protein JST97_06685 [bacterium]|nr:hypothetical protein [bacterium]